MGIISIIIIVSFALMGFGILFLIIFFLLAYYNEKHYNEISEEKYWEIDTKSVIFLILAVIFIPIFLGLGVGLRIAQWTITNHNIHEGKVWNGQLYLINNATGAKKQIDKSNKYWINYEGFWYEFNWDHKTINSNQNWNKNTDNPATYYLIDGKQVHEYKVDNTPPEWKW